MNRDSFAIDARRQRVAQLYLERKFQTEIAHILGVDQKTVSRDLQAIQRHWLQSSLRDFDAIKAEQLAIIDKVELAAWEAYHRSCQPREVSTREATDDGTGTEYRKAVVRTEQQIGDPRFLERVQKCIDQRATLIGLNAAMKYEIKWEELTDEQLGLLASGVSPEKVLRVQESTISADTYRRLHGTVDTA